MARLLLLIVMVMVIVASVACGGGGSRPGARSPTNEPAADRTLGVDCKAACARLNECGVGSGSSCESECQAGHTDDAGWSRWACLSSAQSCGEVTECTTTAD
jgi:hypothetical protein